MHFKKSREQGLITEECIVMHTHLNFKHQLEPTLYFSAHYQQTFYQLYKVVISQNYYSNTISQFHFECSPPV